MKAHITIERTLSRGYEIEYSTLEDLRQKADALLEQVQQHPEEMEDCGEAWDYAATDADGYRDLIPWSR